MAYAEINNFEAFKKKMQNICDEHDLVFTFSRNKYPMTLTIKPVGGMDAQIDMLRSVEDNGYTSPDAYIKFDFLEGKVSYRMSKEFSISDTLLQKIKNLFCKMVSCYLQYFYRDCIENDLIKSGQMPEIDEEEAEDLPDGAEPIEELEDDRFDGVEISDDELEEATRIVRMENKCTTAFLQRRMKLGYHHAAALVNALENAGIVGEYNGGETREILPFDEPTEEEEV